MCILLERRQVGVLHARNLYRLKTLDTAFETAINLNRWEEAVDFGTKLLPGLQLVLGGHFVISQQLIPLYL